MMEEQLEKFQYLWDGTAPQWALIKLDSTSAFPQYLIMNSVAKSAKIIEDDSVANRVVEKMLAAGVRVLSPGQA